MLEKMTLREKPGRLDWLQLAVLCLTAPLFLFPRLNLVWAFAAIPALWICRRLSGRGFLERTALDWQMALLSLQVLATCLIVPDLSFSLAKISGVLLGIFSFYVLTSVLASERTIQWAVLGFLGVGTLMALVGLLGMNWDYDSLIFSLARFFGIGLDKTVFHEKVIPFLKHIIPSPDWNLPGAEHGFNANAVAGMVILIIPLVVSLLFPLLKKHRKKEWFLARPLLLGIILVVLFFLSTVLFITLSVGSWMALTLSFWILFFPRKWKVATFILFLVLVGAAAVFWRQDISNAADSLSKGLDREKIAFRLSWWKVGLETIRESPIFGIGLNRVRLIPQIGYERSHLHNHFLHTAAELGLPGLVAYLALLLGAGWMCWKVYRKSGFDWMKKAGLGLGCGQLAHFLFGFTDSIPLGAKVGIVFWLSLALIAALYNILLKAQDESRVASHENGQ